MSDLPEIQTTKHAWSLQETSFASKPLKVHHDVLCALISVRHAAQAGSGSSGAHLSALPSPGAALSQAHVTLKGGIVSL